MKSALFAAALASLSTFPAIASQGPGVSSGTASASEQIAVATIIAALPIALFAVGVIKQLLRRK